MIQTLYVVCATFPTPQLQEGTELWTASGVPEVALLKWNESVCHLDPAVRDGIRVRVAQFTFDKFLENSPDGCASGEIK